MISKDRINEDLLDSQFVWDCWETNAKKIPDNVAIIHWDALDKPFRWTYSSLLENSLKIADDLIDMGVKKGDVCALIIRHNKYFYPIYMGIAAIGAIPSVLAYPNPRLHPDKFMQGLSGMAQHSGIDWILTEKDLEPKIKKIINNKSNSIKGFILPLESIKNRGAYEVNWDKIRKAREGAICTDSFLLQHSSGTTGLQKGIVLSHKAVLEHAHRYSRSILLATSDKIASWLPLYHDMGLIAAFHLPLAYGVPIIQIDPFQWVSRPVILLQAISSEKATLAWLPNFAYNFMADRINEEDLKDVRLDCVRMLINCSEPVRESSHQKFIDRFVKYGIKKVCLAACYAMAETTFAVTQTDPGIQAKK